MAPVLDLGDLEGQQQDEGELDDLVGLEIHGESGNNPVQSQPVPVSAHRFSQRREEQEDQNYAETKQQLPVFFREQLKIYKSEQHVGNHAQADADHLDQDRLDAAFIAGGGVDQDQSETAGHQTQGQQDQIALSEELTNGRKQGDQGVTSLRLESNNIFYHILVETQTAAVV